METYTITTANTTASAAVAGVAIGMFITMGFVALVVGILRIIARWRIFKKAGEKGWKAIIPFYSDYIFYKIIDMVPFFWAAIAGAFLVGVIAAATGSNAVNVINFAADGSVSTTTTQNVSPLFVVAELALGVFCIVTAIIAAVRLAKVFKKGGGTIAGLILLPDIFLMILGFGSAKYDKKALKK